MPDWILPDWILPDWTALPIPMALAGLTVLLVAETALVIGVVLPGSTAAITLGALAKLGSVPVSTAVLAASCAAILGGQLAYLAGRRDPRAEGSLGRRIDRLLGHERARAAHRMLRARGAGAVVAGQWIVGVRTLMPRLAGRVGLPHGRFTVHQLPTAATWASILVLAGYGVGSVHEGLGWLTAIPAAAVAALLCALVIRSRRGTSCRDANSPDTAYRGAPNRPGPVT